jgi:hypothetical protein
LDGTFQIALSHKKYAMIEYLIDKPYLKISKDSKEKGIKLLAQKTDKNF